MPFRTPIPDELTHGPFTLTRARQLGVSQRVLRTARFRQPFRGVYVVAELAGTAAVRFAAALLAVGPPCIVSHVSALSCWGLDLPGRWQVHLSTNARTRTRLPGIVIHRRLAPIAAREVGGLPVTAPMRTFVDLAPRLPFVWLVAVGDWLVHAGLTTREDLEVYVWSRHLDGVTRARRAVTFVRDRVESPMESVLRLLIVFARLPEPVCNHEVFDLEGTFVARVDLAYVELRIAIEYDGRWHATSAERRRIDRDRRERLERLGWRVIVVIDTDLRAPMTVVRRVFEARCQAGAQGPAPVTSVVWSRWFSPRGLWSLGDLKSTDEGHQVTKSRPRDAA